MQNIKAFADAVQKAKPAGAKGTYINRVAVSSTMGPGVKVEPASLFGEPAALRPGPAAAQPDNSPLQGRGFRCALTSDA